MDSSKKQKNQSQKQTLKPLLHEQPTFDDFISIIPNFDGQTLLNKSIAVEKYPQDLIFSQIKGKQSENRIESLSIDNSLFLNKKSFDQNRETIKSRFQNQNPILNTKPQKLMISSPAHQIEDQVSKHSNSIVSISFLDKSLSKYKVTSNSFSALDQTKFENDIKSIIKQFKIDDELNKKMRQIVFMALSVKNIVDQVGKSKKQALSLKMHSLKQKVALARIELKITTKSEQIAYLCKQFDIPEQHINNLNKIQIIQKQQFYRRVQQIGSLFPNEQKVDIEKELQNILKNNKIDDELLQVSITNFKNYNFQQIIEEAPKRYKQNVRKQLAELKKKLSVHQNKMPASKTLNIAEILKFHNIPTDCHKEYIDSLNQGNFEFLLKINEFERKKILPELIKRYKPNSSSLKTRIFIILGLEFSDQNIQQIIDRIKNRQPFSQNISNKTLRKEIDQLIKEFTFVIKFKFETKNIHVEGNQLTSNNYKKLIAGKIRKQEDDLLFLDSQHNEIKFQKIKYEAGKQYEVIIHEHVQYSCRYGKKKFKINLIPDLPIIMNKQIIYKQLINKNLLVYNQLDRFNLQNIRLKYHLSEDNTNTSDNTLQFIEQQIDQINLIQIEVKLKIILFNQDKKQQIQFSSNQKIKNLKQYINANAVPYQSQVLQLILQKNNIITIQETQQNDLIIQVSKNWIISFELLNRASLQFYGFNYNIPLTFEKFSEFFIENENSTIKFIQSCSFLKNKQDQIQFLNQLLYYLYSGIKKRFSLKTILNKFKKIISKLKSEHIWIPIKSDQALKFNQTFVMAFLLENADNRLRIQLMNLLKQNMPIPLFMHIFDNIAVVKQQKLNQQLLFVLKQGFTFTSIGFHSDDFQKNSNFQKGKSCLLNELFTTQFQICQNKHPIVKGLPYISLRTYQDIFPLHIIDIPYDTSDEIKQQILKYSNIVLIHSWRNQKQTLQYIAKVKKNCQGPIICLMRDKKMNKQSSLRNLKNNGFKNQEPLDIINLQRNQNCKQEINVLKDEIHKIISENYKKSAKLNKIYGLYKANKMYSQFSKHVQKIKNNMFNLTPIGNQMQKIKELRKCNDQINIKKIKQLKQILRKSFSKQLMDILDYMTKKQVKPFQNLIMNLLRQKLKTFQSQLNIKYKKIYDYRDQFKQIINLKEEVKIKQIKILHQKLKQLDLVYNQKANQMNDEQFYSVIEQMIANYQNKIKLKIFSLQLLWRQLNYMIYLDENFMIKEKKLLDIAIELKQIQINGNLPFQIIDGDLLEMPKKLILKLFQNKDDKAIVLTVLGPQSSGKSTLLNFLFGCDFATSAGRCTRGVYGTYFKFAQNKGRFSESFDNCDGIFVIDTEGLFALTNKKDENNQNRKDLQSKMVLFCLAISDFIIVNVRGNFDKNTEKLIRICHQKLEQLNIQKQKRPQIIVVLNQNPSDKKQESQNQFKKIRESIDFDISKSLSLAYKFQNYGQQQINLFQKSQKLTKKIPQQSFLKETTSLMHQILKKIEKKRKVQKLSDLVIKFQTIWSLVDEFPNLSKCVTKQYRKIEKQIKIWKDEQSQMDKKYIMELIEIFKKNGITQKEIIQNIQQNGKKLTEKYEKQFKLKANDDEDIKILKKQQKNKIWLKILSQLASIKYELQNIQLQKKIRISKIEGDIILKEKAKQIYNDQFKNGNVYTDEQKKRIFDEYFNIQMANILATSNLGQQKNRQFHKIYQDYQFLIKDQTRKQTGLPRCDKIKLQQCETQDIKEVLKRRLINPFIKNYEDVLESTNKIHTNILKGGKSDVTSEYFDIKKYFKENQLKQYFSISNHFLIKSLKTDLIKIKIQQISKEIMKNYNSDQYKLKQIFNQINSYFKYAGFSFRFSKFQQIINCYNKHVSILGFLKIFTPKQISYEFVHPFSKQFRSDIRKCRFIIPSVQKTNISYYSYNSNNISEIFLKKRLYQHIDWEEIKKYMEEFGKQKNYQEAINYKMTQIINEDIKQLNIQIIETVNWLQYFSKSSNLKSMNYFFDKIQFGQRTEQSNIYKSQYQMFELIQKLKFMNVKFIKNNCRKNQQNLLKIKTIDVLIIGKIVNKKLISCDKSGHFSNYIGQNTDLTIQSLKKKQFKKYIFNQLKNQIGSFDKFIDTIYKIVEKIIEAWKEVNKKTLAEIYNQINQQICKFNNDLNQISCNLSERFIGHIHLGVVYMIWKLVIAQKIKQKSIPYEAKLKDYENQWNQFRARTSNDQQNIVKSDIKEFTKYFVNLIGEQNNRKKEQYMKNQQKKFKSQNCRNEIQNLIDMNIFTKQASQLDILQYLQQPEVSIEKKYKDRYQISWENFCMKYKSDRFAVQIFQEFYKLIQNLQTIISKLDLNDDKKMFTDIFKLIDPQNTTDQITADQYDQAGKKILFQYLIDILTKNNPNQKRKCSKLQVKAIYQIKIVSSISDHLKTLLTQLKTNKILSITNFVTFIKGILGKQVKKQFQKQINNRIVLVQQDQYHFISMIKVVICSQKCPCCGRICGIQGEHTHHKCLYGHQMRGLNGTYIQLENKEKQASVIRCQQMSETDQIQYNGKKYTWTEFKAYWKDKVVGGWLFDDATIQNIPNKSRFEHAWTIAGPIYCKSKGVNYITYNKIQKQRSISPLHYIFALDSSGSMNTDFRWQNLQKSLKSVIDLLVQKDKNKNCIKISIITFNNSAQVIYQNQNPNLINSNIKLKMGDTRFNPPFLLAAQIATKYIDKAIVVFIFMTDGEAQYPEKGIEQLKKLQIVHKTKLRYAGMEFKCDKKVMKQIAKSLNGQSRVAYDLNKLTEIFTKSIEIIEFKEMI